MSIINVKNLDFAFSLFPILMDKNDFGMTQQLLTFSITACVCDF